MPSVLYPLPSTSQKISGSSKATTIASAKGFTFIELMVTVAVLGIVLAVAIPSMQSFVVANRLAGINNDLMTALTLARSEAVRRATTVSVCKSADGATCGGDWKNGWIVFVNSDDDKPAAVDVPVEDTGEVILRIFPALPSGYTLAPNHNFTNYVTYDRSGAANTIGTFVACHDNDESTARGIILTRLRPRIAADTDGDGIPNKDRDNNIDSCEAP